MSDDLALRRAQLLAARREKDLIEAQQGQAQPPRQIQHHGGPRSCFQTFTGSAKMGPKNAKLNFSIFRRFYGSHFRAHNFLF